jgi:hypothetical protein
MSRRRSAALGQRLAGALFGLWFGLSAAMSALAADAAGLADFARRVGLSDVDRFVATIEALDATGRLPERYITKGQAETLGWRPGADLCCAVPGRLIGGDPFGNREARLPRREGRRYTEADLDYACGQRGAKRLVFSNDGLRYVTVDHYQSFHAVPR